MRCPIYRLSPAHIEPTQTTSGEEAREVRTSNARMDGEGVPLQLIPPQPSLHSHCFPSSRRWRSSPSASESHSASIRPTTQPSAKKQRQRAMQQSADEKHARGVKQSMPPHPGGHLHWPSYGSQSPYCPHVNAGKRQLKHGGHFSGEAKKQGTAGVNAGIDAVEDANRGVDTN